MSPNENNSGFVPKFERELREAGGDLSALKKDKKKEAVSADDIDMEIDLSSLRSVQSEEQADETAPEIEVEDIPAPSQAEPDVNEENIDFVYGEDDSYDYTGSLDAISADSIALDDMGSNVKLEEMRTDESSIINSIKNQMQEDDLVMSVTNRPKLDDMSDEYAPIQRTAADIAAKEQLDRDEKELIKNRLKTEIESKPEGYDKKKSLAMYKKLMEEQKAKAAKKGFIQLLVTAALGLVSAVIVYFIKPGGDSSYPILDYLPMGALVFALLMLLKSKFGKILSALYFLAAAVLLTYPGLVGYARNTDNQALGTEFLIKLAMYIAAAVLSAVIFIRLVGNKDIEAYYSYKPGSSMSNRHR